MAQYIDISVGESRQVGSCNACDDFASPEGTNNHQVAEVSLRVISFRLCDKCRLKLLEQLGRVVLRRY